MDLCVVIKGMSFLLQTSMGILGNCIILFAYIQVLCKLTLIDIILSQIAFANTMVLLTRGVPQTMTVFESEHILDDVGCKTVIYLYRIVRALSVCMTCLLSVFQAVTLMPVNSRWSHLKTIVPKHLVSWITCIWLLNMAVCIAAPFFSSTPRNGTIQKFTLNLGFCHVHFPDQVGYIINGVAVSVRDFIFVILMVLASVYILLILYRHHRQVQGIKSSNNSQKTVAETKAARTVLQLVLLYVIFFGIDNIIWIYMLTVTQVPVLVTDMRVFFSSCYASFSPLIIIGSNRRIQNIYKFAFKKEKLSRPDVYVSHVKV
ncbi:olfactory receptor class A-like protein 1 [Rhinatrema bivittatum]|uniref:olfactory receptor class A-like protein 1 n=1 Tax=Rhinatrema bivittatum TaxID=194408 RepID=UPI001127F2C8|nr:olfactory receptor class A-like protein 1 [Rhinatrema bivittatum]